MLHFAGMRHQPNVPHEAVNCIALFSTNNALSAEIFGGWSRDDGKAQVNVARCGADICATNTWIKPGTESEKVGDVLVMTIKPTDAGGYEGTAYDPQRDMTYKMSVAMDANSMTTKGCVLGGLLCRNVGWTRRN